MPIGLLVIGQSPRPDLTGPVRAALPHATLLEAGALDGLTAQDLPTAQGAAYPLSTRLADGTPVIVPEAFLLPRLQQALERLEAQGCQASLLLCAGTFASLHGTRPLFKPFDLAVSTLRSLGLTSLALFAPFAQQQPAILARWQAVGFHAAAWTPPLPTDPSWPAWLDAHRADLLDHQAIVLDYVGHSPVVRQALQSALPRPVLDIGHLAVAQLAAVG
jgi:protein AroM